MWKNIYFNARFDVFIMLVKWATRTKTLLVDQVNKRKKVQLTFAHHLLQSQRFVNPKNILFVLSYNDILLATTFWRKNKLTISHSITDLCIKYTYLLSL